MHLGTDRVWAVDCVEKGSSVTRTAVRSVLVSIGVAALLAGCGSMSAGSAAVVGDRRISVADVQSATVDAQTWVGEGGQITQTQILYLIAVAPYIQEVAVALGAGASDDEARRVLAQKVPNPSPAAISVIRANISLNDMQQQLGEERTGQVLAEVTKKLTAEGFKINPRFGTFDAATGRISPDRPNWLISNDTSQPPASPSPAP